VTKREQSRCSPLVKPDVIAMFFHSCSLEIGLLLQKNKMSIPVANIMPVPKQQSALNLLRPILKSLIKYIEEKLAPVIHISKGITRSNPLFNPTWKR
jgi:hypothetical protein